MDRTSSVMLLGMYACVSTYNFVSYCRGRFEGVCQPVFQLCVSPIQEVLTSVKLTEADINKVIMIWFVILHLS